MPRPKTNRNFQAHLSAGSSRRAFTLLHLMVVISVSAILMTMAVLWAATTLKFAVRVRGHQRQHSRLTQLARDLRADVQASTSLKLEDDRRLVLLKAGQQTTYEISESTVRFEQQAGDRVRRETFSLNSDSWIEWDSSGLPDTIGLVVTRLGLAAPPESLAEKMKGTGVEPSTPEELNSLPIDIHIYATKGRWPVKYPAQKTIAVDWTGEKADEADDENETNPGADPDTAPDPATDPSAVSEGGSK